MAYNQKNKNLINIRTQVLNMNMIYICIKILIVQKGYNIGSIFKYLLKILRRDRELNLTLGICIEIKVYLTVVCCLEFYMQIRNSFSRILEKKIGILIQKSLIQFSFQQQINQMILILYIKNVKKITTHYHLFMRYNKKMKVYSLLMTNHIHILKI